MKNTLCLLAFLCLYLTGKSQETANEFNCSRQKLFDIKPLAKTTVQSILEDDYDISWVKFNLAVNNTSTNLSGDVTTRATVVVSSMSAYVFELNPQLIIDSVLIDGILMPVTGSSVLKTVNFPVAKPVNTIFTAQVFYHGQPGSSAGFWGNGIRNQSSPSWGTQVTYTMSQPYGSRDWWPTKQSLTDKIDSADIWITVPSNLKAGSNGLLKNITPMPASKSRYEWKTTYPTDYYLFSFSVAPYVDYSTYVHFPSSTDSMLYQNYIYSNPATLPFWKPQIDSVPGMITYFSQLFGRYPFWKEKYGHCMAPLSGGMEHQTMTTCGFFTTTLTAHELGHQWFGDNVTCGSWKDIWLNEGFATYSEYLYVNNFRGPTQAFDLMKNKHEHVMDTTDGSVYVDDTTDQARIFSGRLTYDKGASIIHTLRFVFNNDNQFFFMLKNYQTLLANKTATTLDFRHHAEIYLGKSLDTFMNQWIFGQGYPVYSARWAQNGSDVIVKLDQAGTHPSVPFYYTPLEITFKSSQGDTTIRIENNQPQQTLLFNLNKTIQGLEIDSKDWLVNDVDTIYMDSGLVSVTEPTAAKFDVYPNPTTNSWNITNIHEPTSLALTDLNGRTIWASETSKNIVVPGNDLPSGVYLLRMKNSSQSATIKLIRE
jgi:aminopeptidase N